MHNGLPIEPTKRRYDIYAMLLYENLYKLSHIFFDGRYSYVVAMNLFWTEILMALCVGDK